MSDWAEFVAGTDPNSALPTGSPAGLFRLTPAVQANQQIRFDWPTAPNHAYRLIASPDLVQWSPYTDWLRAAGYSATFTLPTPTNGAPSYFRLEAQP